MLPVRVDVAEIFPQAFGDADQQLIADVVPEAVVDDLEAVKVEEEDRELVVGDALGAVDRLLEPIGQQ